MFRFLKATLAVVCIWGVSPDAVSAASFEQIIITQTKLQHLGFDPGEADGRMGPKTRKALIEAGKEYGFEPKVGSLIEHFSAVELRNRVPLEDNSAIKAVEDAVKEGLKDPFSAQFRDFFTVSSGKVCGQVNAKNSYGAYVGWKLFVTTPLHKVGDQYLTLLLSLEGPDDFLPPYYCSLGL